MIKKTFNFIILLLFAAHSVSAGILVTRSNGISLTGADGVTLSGADGATLTGADGATLTGADDFLAYRSNGISLTGADGATLTGADGATLTGADGVTFTGGNGVVLSGADGISIAEADGATLTGADGVSLTGADGVTYRATTIQIIRPTGVTLSGADGATLTGADGATLTGADGATLTGADGATLTGIDGATLTGADHIYGLGSEGLMFSLVSPTGVTLSGADGATLTGADGITITGATGITLTGADSGQVPTDGFNSLDPELALLLNETTDDSGINAVIVYHQYPGAVDEAALQQIGILGGTKYRMLPMIAITATKDQIIEISRLANVRSIYGNRTLDLTVDPFFNNSGVQRVPADNDLTGSNSGLPISGKNVTVAVLDTGVNAQHNDLAGRVVQNVRLVDTQSAPAGFTNPIPVENVVNSDPVSGHGTFVAGVVAASGVSSGGKYAGVAPGARILGMSAGDLNLSHILSGFDYLLEKGSQYNVRVVNCSFSSNTVYNPHDPVNVATRMLTDSGINVVFSAGNTGPGNGTLNPYASAPWVVSVGAVRENNKLASFSSRGVFGSELHRPTLVATGENVVSLRSVASQTGVLGVAAGSDLDRLSPAEMVFYTTASGTSFSAPQVAGAIALMIESNPNLTPSEVKDILQRTATPLPQYYQHEVGAGVLNTHAAVLEAAFPERKMGIFRSVLGFNPVRFTSTVAHTFEGTVNPGSQANHQFDLPDDIVQSKVQIAWGMGVNDLGLRVYDQNNNLVGNSNLLNLPGLTGRNEKLVLDNPGPQTYRASIYHTAGAGYSQQYFGQVQTTAVDYGNIRDLDNMTPQTREIVKYCLRTHIMSSNGSRFHPDHKVSRLELAATLLKSGKVQQYMAASPVYVDVSDGTRRSIVESVQLDSRGMLIYDAPLGSTFHSFKSATRLVTAVALVKAADLESRAQTATLPIGISDAVEIPSLYRGHVAVALEKGFLKLDNGAFRPNQKLTREELARGIYSLVRAGL